jgi:beta-N-acetylhexosaminidase
MILKEIANNKLLSKPVIYGIKGLELSDEEKYFFKQNGCVGFILFARNIKDKTQLKNLTKSLKELMEGEVLILIDQEGGRVARMTSPHWKCYPNGEFFDELYRQDKQKALDAIYQNFKEIAFDLNEVGINVNCAPILDLKRKETHEIIGNRAYGSDAFQVAQLGRKVCEALLENEVYPIIKHIPGHGRATCDSHLELPRVDASYDELKKTDFEAFKILNDQKFAMTAHIIYSALDEKNCATVSPKIIDLIRKEIGFKNILMSDDLSMKALKGSFSSRAKSVIEAGCDLVLHCNGDMAEMQEINSALPNIADKLKNKFYD